MWTEMIASTRYSLLSQKIFIALKWIIIYNQISHTHCSQINWKGFCAYYSQFTFFPNHHRTLSFRWYTQKASTAIVLSQRDYNTFTSFRQRYWSPYSPYSSQMLRKSTIFITYVTNFEIEI